MIISIELSRFDPTFNLTDIELFGLNMNNAENIGSSSGLEHCEPGPVEVLDWPARLVARVVSSEPNPRIHGYDLATDLSLHYGFTDLVLLSLTGELPDETTGRAFEVCLLFLSPIGICEAPVHAASIARQCGSPRKGVLGTGAILLAEQGSTAISNCKEFLAWLDRVRADSNDKTEQSRHKVSLVVPEVWRAKTDDERKKSASFCHAVRSTGFAAPFLASEFEQFYAIVAVLYSCGLTQAWQLETVLMLARLPCLSAEAFLSPVGNIAAYPARLPNFRYTNENPK